MDDWDNFYMLAGGTAGTLIGLIFVVITLGIDHAQEGDEARARFFVTPILVYFTSLLVISMVMVPPMSALARAVSLGLIGCAGLAYVLNLGLLTRPIPLDLQPVPVIQVWHGRYDTDPAHAWLRSQVRQALQAVGGVPQPDPEGPRLRSQTGA